MAGKPVAIVEDFPGTTRDRVFVDVTWNRVDFSVIDTGGWSSRMNPIYPEKSESKPNRLF
jgi:GTP-binding protein